LHPGEEVRTTVAASVTEGRGRGIDRAIAPAEELVVTDVVR